MRESSDTVFPCTTAAIQPKTGAFACGAAVLRDQWKSKAYVVSDAGAIRFAQTDHEYAPSQPAAAADALLAGADLALGGGYDSAGQPESFAALAKVREEGETPLETHCLSWRFRCSILPQTDPFTCGGTAAVLPPMR